ncbi:MAG TPA: ABC transporter substrate-binding protein [Pusillimonas sp.]|uniref:ABC transporter substrate-binding protein n=1 Tax=Pusillimonas sp. TaxID=3040095 RepID=UPI002B4AF782|nr:ABC transporter substrate-binding protein [Pusillimonas sp.]HLU20602.1 ABC transporter substrate-binding protein [Pusillimonas sp.]
MTLLRRIKTSVLAVALVVAPSAMAQDVVKVGLITSLTGPFAEFGQQMQAGVKAYQAMHGDTVAGKRVEVIFRDTGGANPEVAKRHAQELFVREKVDFLAGFAFTPSALAAAPIATQAKIPMVVMNAAGENLPSRSPYMIRVAFEVASTVPPIAKWAYREGARTAYVIAADYAPGLDAEKAFIKAFEAEGGKIIGTVRTPIVTVDFSPYIMRIKDAKPDVIFAFVNGGDVAPALLREYRTRNLEADGIKLIGTGDIVDEPIVNVIGQNGVGVVTVYPYSMHHDSELNRRFVAEFLKLREKNARPAIMAVAAYDGMAAIYKALEKTQGDTDGAKLMEAFKGMEFESPRGQIRIDPETRDVIHNQYIRRFDKVDDVFVNVEFETFKAGE